MGSQTYVGMIHIVSIGLAPADVVGWNEQGIKVGHGRNNWILVINIVKTWKVGFNLFLDGTKWVGLLLIQLGRQQDSFGNVRWYIAIWGFKVNSGGIWYSRR